MYIVDFLTFYCSRGKLKSVLTLLSYVLQFSRQFIKYSNIRCIRELLRSAKGIFLQRHKDLQSLFCVIKHHKKHLNLCVLEYIYKLIQLNSM